MEQEPCKEDPGDLAAGSGQLTLAPELGLLAAGKLLVSLAQGRLVGGVQQLPQRRADDILPRTANDAGKRAVGGDHGAFKITDSDPHRRLRKDLPEPCFANPQFPLSIQLRLEQRLCDLVLLIKGALPKRHSVPAGQCSQHA